MSSVPPAVNSPLRTDRGMLSKVRLAPALTGTICARMPRSIPAFAAMRRPSSEVTKFV
jgi:hypothetical protein